MTLLGSLTPQRLEVKSPVAIRENHGRKFPADYLGHEIPAQVQCLAQDTLQEFLGRARGWSGLVPCASLSLSGFGEMNFPWSLLWGTQYHTAVWALISGAQGIRGPHVATLPC